jgi:N-acylglucosamine 2-epimerase
LTREGEPSGYQRKPYAAVFMMLGLLEYAKAARDGVIYREAVELYWRVAEWIESPGKLGRPVLAGAPEYSQLADIYVAAFMSLELASYDPDPRFRGIMVECLELAERHYDPERRILRENLGPTEFPEGRLFSAGSSLEVAWILLRLLDYHPDERRKKWILEAIEGSLDWGWDHEYGGLYYFQDVESKPLLQLEGSMKLWWVHVEALVAVVHAYKISGEDRWLEWLEILDTYCWRHFRDSEYGEWFGYLDRRGERTHSLKGNNYKGCFHVPRGMLLCSQMLES